MDLDLLFLVGNKEQSTKSCIILGLAAHCELSITQIHSLLKREFSRKVSYQAIRQALTELMKTGVLVKKGKLYAVNSQWVVDLKDVVDTLDRATRKRQVCVVDKETTQVTLKNLYELGHFILFGLDQKYFDFSKKGELYLALRHLWIPFADAYRRERLVSIFQENKTGVIVQGKSAGDKMLSHWYKKYGQIRLGVVSFSSEYIVHGDSVVQIFMDEKLKKKMDDVYSLRGLIRQDLYRQVSDMTYEPYRIQLIITRNSEIAQHITQQIQKHFKS
jgi:hypothetical protein